MQLMSVSLQNDFMNNLENFFSSINWKFKFIRKHSEMSWPSITFRISHLIKWIILF
jgi:hypothetical protein